MTRIIWKDIKEKVRAFSGLFKSPQTNRAAGVAHTSVSPTTFVGETKTPNSSQLS